MAADENGTDACTWYTEINRHLYLQCHVHKKLEVKRKGRVVTNTCPTCGIKKGERLNLSRVPTLSYTIGQVMTGTSNFYVQWQR